MRISLKRIAVLGTMLVPLLAGMATAQDAPAKKPVNTKAAYAALARLPDWRGTWSPEIMAKLFSRMAAAPQPDLTPAGQKLVDDFKKGRAEGKNLQIDAANCIPQGMPYIMQMPYPIEFLFTPGRVTLITETDSQVRRIFTDGRKLPDDPDPSFNGSSVGHWEGKTLVVDTIALNPKNTITQTGIRVTENTKIHERFHMDKPGVISVETTITDPTLFKTPYTTKASYYRKPGWEIREYACEENNHDAADPFGRPSLDLK